MQWHRSAYIHGDYNVRCDISGFKIKASQAKKQWNNLLVKETFWEARQPQDFVRSVQDRQTVPDARTEGTDVFIGTNDVDPTTL